MKENFRPLECSLPCNQLDCFWLIPSKMFFKGVAVMRSGFGSFRPKFQQKEPQMEFQVMKTHSVEATLASTDVFDFWMLKDDESNTPLGYKKDQLCVYSWLFFLWHLAEDIFSKGEAHKITRPHSWYIFSGQKGVAKVGELWTTAFLVHHPAVLHWSGYPMHLFSVVRSGGNETWSCFFMPKKSHKALSSISKAPMLKPPAKPT